MNVRIRFRVKHFIRALTGIIFFELTLPVLVIVMFQIDKFE
jgi:hypothetical protein